MRNKTGQSRRVSVPSPAIGVRGGAAFTLVELIVVLLIIGLLMAVVVPATNYAINLGVATRAQIRVDKLANAAEGYKLEKGHYPGQRDTAALGAGTYTGSQVLAACAFDYGYAYINQRFVSAENDPPSYATSKYAGYEKDSLLSDTEDTEDTDDTLYTLNEKMHTLSDGFWITPMAICYYVSWPGQTGLDQFQEADNNEYTDDNIADGEDFAAFITTNYPDMPHNDGMFLLISAGADREFFSDDDATNWKKTE